MCSKQKIRKTALILLLVAFFSLIPSNTFRVFADSDIVPPFPYDELQTIGENDYALFKVHGVEQVDYIEVLMPKIVVHGNYEHLMPGLSYSALGGWVLQINSIDYYFKDGQPIYFDLQSLFTTSFMPVNNDDDYFPAWLELVYTTEDIWGRDEDSYNDRGLRFFMAQNFIIDPAATPTPTPIPAPEPLKDWNDYDNTDSFAFVVKCISSPEGSSYIVNHYYGVGSSAIYYPTYAYYINNNRLYDYDYYGLLDKFVKTTSSSCDEVTYDIELNDYSVNGDRNISILGSGNTVDGFSLAGFPLREDSIYKTFRSREYSRNYNNFDETDWVISSDLSYFNGYIFEIVATNHSLTVDSFNNTGTDDFIPSIVDTSPALPTPTTAPTPIPQPSETPEADNDSSGWGWGIVNTLRYIFIPDKNKLIRLEKTAQTRFQQFGGGYDDLKRVSGFEDPVRPQNVIMNWTPFSTDPDEQQPQQQITLVDFEQIDFYLFQTSSGMFIKDCLSASFTFLMFGYLIHVIRKHFVIENTDDDEKGGGD